MHTKSGRSDLNLIFCSFLAIFLLVSCGLTASQRKALKEFSSATASIGEVTSAELVRMRNEIIQMNVHRLRITEVKDMKLPDDKDLDKALDVEDVVERVRAAEVLQTYGELLLSLAEDTQQEELSAAADRFVQNVKGLPGVDRKLTQEQLDGIGKVVKTVGGLIVEHMKAKAIKLIVRDTSGQVEHLCDLLEADFDHENDRLAGQFVASTEKLLTASGKALERSGTLEERIAAIDALKLGRANRDRREEVLDRISQAVVKIKSANAELDGSLNSNKVTVEDLKEFSTRVRSLIDALKVLK